jgi:hypothetical protein
VIGVISWGEDHGGEMAGQEVGRAKWYREIERAIRVRVMSEREASIGTETSKVMRQNVSRVNLTEEYDEIRTMSIVQKPLANPSSPKRPKNSIYLLLHDIDWNIWFFPAQFRPLK